MSHFLLHTAPIDLEVLAQLIDQPTLEVRLAPEAAQAIERCRIFLDEKMASNSEPIYGINTGFGDLRDKKVDRLEELQYNLMRSHACGAGTEVPAPVVRLMLLLKARSLAYGHSGVQVATVQRLLDFYNHGVLPVVYTQGSLGASGDLAPLAHLCLPLIGEGEVVVDGERLPAAELLRRKGWLPLQLKSKEGLALLNGTQFMLAYGLHTLLRAQRLINAADQTAALSLDAYDGRLDPFHPRLHEIRPHAGQIRTAANVRAALAGSERIHEPKSDVQDPYSFRCVPQVHGASRDVIAYCTQVFVTEANSTTDNPNIFVDEDLVLSGGNFHGQPLAMALDMLAIAVAELGSISERRTYLMQAGKRGLKPFLATDPGLESGLMIAQYTAASIASQNKQLCTPAVVDSIPSSNGQEDHVSMGANGAVKALQVLENVSTILGIELMHASQALHQRGGARTSPFLENLLAQFRKVVPPLTCDRYLSPDIAAARTFVTGWIPAQP